MGNFINSKYDEFINPEIDNLIHKCKNNDDYKNSHSELLNKITKLRQQDKGILYYKLCHIINNGFIFKLIGDFYVTPIGNSENIDYGQALSYYQEASRLNNAHAIYDIGYFYANGLGVITDYTEAKKWYMKACNLKYPDAINGMGLFYKNGLGVAVDYKEAMELYLNSATHKNPHAMNNIGYMYEKGLGVDIDYELAMVWYLQAAELRNNNAMDNIGNLWEKGLGVDKDLKKARYWYSRAQESILFNYAYNKITKRESDEISELKFLLKVTSCCSDDMVKEKQIYKDRIKELLDKQYLVLLSELVKNSDNLALLKENHKVLGDEYTELLYAPGNAGYDMAKNNFDLLAERLKY